MRWIARLAVLYLTVALSMRLAEALGMRRCGCAADCWGQRAWLNTFRWVFPYGHQGLEPSDKQRLAEV